MKKITKRTGRREKPERDKVKQKKVYITDAQEDEVLAQTKQPDLTSVIKSHLIGGTKLD